MKTATGTRENVKVIEEFTSGGLKVEVLEYENFSDSQMLPWHSRFTSWNSNTSMYVRSHCI